MKSLTIEKFQEVLELARATGIRAAESALEAERKRSGTDGPFDNCGGAYMVLKVDRRTRASKFLDAHPNPAHGVKVEYCAREKGYVLGIPGLSIRQEKYLNQIAKEAALKVIEDELGIPGSIRSYDD